MYFFWYTPVYVYNTHSNHAVWIHLNNVWHHLLLKWYFFVTPRRQTIRHLVKCVTYHMWYIMWYVTFVFVDELPWNDVLKTHWNHSITYTRTCFFARAHWICHKEVVCRSPSFLVFMTLHLMHMPLPSLCTIARTHPLLSVVFHNKWHSCGWVVVMGKRSIKFRVAEKRFQYDWCHTAAQLAVGRGLGRLLGPTSIGTHAQVDWQCRS